MWTVTTWYVDSDIPEVTYFIARNLSYVLDRYNWRRANVRVAKIEITSDELAMM